MGPFCEDREKIDTCYVYTSKNSKKNSTFELIITKPVVHLVTNLAKISHLTIILLSSVGLLQPTKFIFAQNPVRNVTVWFFHTGILKNSLNFAAPNSTLYETSQIMLTGRGNMIRPTHGIEKI